MGYGAGTDTCLGMFGVCVRVGSCTFVLVCVCVCTTRLSLGGVKSVRRCICFSCMSVCVCEYVSGFVFVHFLCVCVRVSVCTTRLGLGGYGACGVCVARGHREQTQWPSSIIRPLPARTRNHDKFVDYKQEINSNHNHRFHS